MLKLSSKHLLTGEELSKEEVHSLLQLASELKEHRNNDQASTLLKGKHLALLSKNLHCVRDLAFRSLCMSSEEM